MSHPSLNPRRRQRGLSLIELMVAVAINLVVVIAAAYVYLGSRESQRALVEKSTMFENGNFALELIGRELENAGFYPALSAEGNAMRLTINGYVNPVGLAPAPYQSGLFGCDDQLFLPATTACGSHPGTPAPPADTIVVNYFTNDSLSLDVGHRADCQRRAVDDDPTNTARRGAATAVTGLPPARPLFVSNRFSLVPSTVQIERQTYSTFSLACNGNGVNPQNNTYQPLVAGIEQLRFRYGPMDSETSMQPSDFKTASAAGSLVAIPVGPGTRAGFARVVSVRACLLVRSMQPARLSRASYSLVDCDGTTKTYSDGVERKVFTQTWAVKNHLTQTYGMP